MRSLFTAAFGLLVAGLMLVAPAQAQDTGKAYYDKYKAMDGVQSTENGVLYRVIQQGDGASPTVADDVTVHYVGKLTNGEIFDSSRQRGEPATFPLGRLIRGWQEAIPLMQVGSTHEMVIPPELGYGANGAGDVIPPNAYLIFEVELLGVDKAQ